MLSPHWNLDSKDKDYTLFTLVFLGLENKYVWEKGREGRKEKGRERRMNYVY